MPVKIRLQRIGAKKKPFYRIVVANSESPRNGRFIENVGTYNTLAEPSAVTLKEDKIREWLEKGARPTKIVSEILKRQGVTLEKGEA